MATIRKTNTFNTPHHMQLISAFCKDSMDSGGK